MSRLAKRLVVGASRKVRGLILGVVRRGVMAALVGVVVVVLDVLLLGDKRRDHQ